MCLAIYKPVGIHIPHKHLQNGFDNNNDGAGIAWAVDGKLHIKKGFFNSDDLIAQYELVKDNPCLIHFRKATHGKIDETNCHPFLFNDNKLALIHNGILSIECCIEGLSDTAHFVKLVLEPLVKGRGVPINDGALHYLIETSIGSDKMAILDEAGNAYVFNESKGLWNEKIWYSNSSYSYGKTVYTPSSTTYSSTYPRQSGDSRHSGWHSKTYRSTKSTHVSTDEADEAYLAFWKSAAHTPLNPKALIGPPKSATQLMLETEDLHPVLTVDAAGNVTEHIEVNEEQTDKGIKQGTMVEYGWWDDVVEQKISVMQKNSGLTREDAIIRIFNEM